MLLVDLDNLYISHNRVDLGLLDSRVAAIKALAREQGVKPQNIWWFGNTSTATLLQQHKKSFSGIQLVTTHVAKDTADHGILHHLATHKWKTASIVSNDKSIARIAWVLFPLHEISSVYFSGRSGTNLSIDRIGELRFKKPEEVLKMMRSMVLYTTRYQPKFLS